MSEGASFARVLAVAFALAALAFLGLGAVATPAAPAALAALAAAGLVVTAALGLGRAAARWLPGLAAEGSGRTGLVVEVLLGLGTLQLVTVLIALAGALHSAVVVALLAASVVAAWWLRPRARRPGRASATRSAPAETARSAWSAWSAWAASGRWTLALCLGPVFAVALLATLPPPTFFDALQYHLVIPAAHVMEGGFAELPDNFFSHLPHGVDMLDALVLSLGRGLVVAPLHWAAAGLCAVALGRLVGRHVHRAAGPLAAAIFFTLSEVALAAAAPAADLFVTAFLLVAIDLVLRADERPELIVPAMLFAGFAAASKVHGGVQAFAVIATALALGRFRLRAPGRLRRTTLAALAFVVPLLPWGAVNLVRHGNPVHPFLASLLGDPRDSEWVAWIASHVHEVSLGGPLELPGALARMLFELDAWHPLPLLVAALPLATLRRRRLRELGLLAVLLLVAWLATSTGLRYGFTVLAIVSAGAAGGALALLSRLPRGSWRRGAGALLIAVLAVSAWQRVIDIVRARDFMPYLAGSESTLAYQQRAIPDSPAATFAWANAELPASARVFSLDEPRVAGLWRPVVAATIFDRPALWRHWSDGLDGPALARRLRAAGFTHVLTSPAHAERLLDRVRSPYRLSAEQRRVAADMLADEAVLVRHDGPVRLYRLE